MQNCTTGGFFITEQTQDFVTEIIVNKLRDLAWFDESWATEVRHAMRLLVCAYAEAYEAVDHLEKPVQFVRLSGLLPGRRLLIIKPLLRDAVASHIEIVLCNTTQLMLRAYRAARPTFDDLRLGVSHHAPPERRAEAEQQRTAFVEKQERVASLLDEAVRDAKELRERIGNKGEGGTKTFKTIIGGIRHLLPIAWAGWVVIILADVLQSTSVQFALYAVGALVVYHALALAGLPFHDAAERKHALFEVYLGGPASDGLAPMFPEVSRFEGDLFKLFGAQPPCVIQWNQVVPLLHYVIAAALVAYAAWALPLIGQTKIAAWIMAGVLIAVYANQLVYWWRLVRMRCRGRSAWQIVWAMLAAIQVLEPLKAPDGGSEDSGESVSEGSE